MKYGPSEWEYKNFGKTSCEFRIEKGDLFEELAKADREATEEYRVVKVPTDMPEFLFRLGELGYIFVETQIGLSMKAEEFRPIAIKNSLYEKIKYVELKSLPRIEEALSFISAGENFVTDRIALDPRFGKETAGLRYFNWIKDIYSRGGSVVLIKAGNELTAFTTLEMTKGGTCHMAIGGMIGTPGEAYYACVDAGERYALAKGAKRLETAVSSNNIPMLRLHEKKGFHVKGMHYVYIKHAGGQA